jgi:hypothetical protein
MKVTEDMRVCAHWLTPSDKTLAIKDYYWASAKTDKFVRKVRYDESQLLKKSLEELLDAGIITHPDLGDVYAMIFALKK